MLKKTSRETNCTRLSTPVSVEGMHLSEWPENPAAEEFRLLPSDSREPIHLENAGSVKLRFPERTKSFALGERLILTPVDLAEICRMVGDETDVIGASGVDYAKKLGIEKVEKNSKPVQ